MLTTNLLVACLGVAFIAFGVIGYRDGFKGAILFPPLIFKRKCTHTVDIISCVDHH